ncbi:MAG: carboxypeptidase regulatory-like domain-containing protein [Longimicrobiales bacterium]
MPRDDRRIARLLVLAASMTVAAPVPGQTLRGRVHESGTSVPIAIVDLTVLGESGRELARTQTDAAGYFSMSWTAGGTVRIRAQRLGFQASTTSELLVRTGEAVTVQMFMSTVPVAVAPVVVRARERENDIMGNFADIERRRKMGLGKFVTREQIEKSGNTRISEVLQHVPGVHLRPEQSNPNSVMAYSNLNTSTSISGSRARGRRTTSMDRPSSTGECPMMIFLDGRIHRYPIAGVNVLPANDIEIIEVYRNMSEVPAVFAGEHVRCGVIALWTRRG